MGLINVRVRVGIAFPLTTDDHTRAHTFYLLGLELHFAVWVSVSQRVRVRVRVRARVKVRVRARSM